jgi:hypothetical protein
MVPNKSLDEYKVIAALLHDAHASNGDVFNTRALKLTLQKVDKRVRNEGIGFLTKTFLRLGKCFDQALTGSKRMNAIEAGFDTLPDSELPRFLGEFFTRVFLPSGELRSDPDATSVLWIRRILYLFTKYELPYTADQEHKVVEAFKQAEADLADMSAVYANWRADLHRNTLRRRDSHCSFARSEAGTRVFGPLNAGDVIREARILLSNLFSSFDPYDITPRHGPGVVATKQRLWNKYRWSNVSGRITEVYPFDAYFCASPGHVCDSYKNFDVLGDTDHSAQVLLVPKDSRGPRLISCEPVDFQWIQQGLRSAIYRLVETHELTKFNVFFTDQGPNQRGALLGSKLGRYATLDLKEASDRVHLDLVRLLFPEHLHRFLEAARSQSTLLPNGEKLKLNKYAPMGSALCFPIMALTIWAILTANTGDADTRESILVYGDDVIVPTAYAESAINILEAFGLKINQAKSCTQGFFRESCGVDAFQGVDVTPVRIRTVWDTTPRPDVYTSWIAYANSFYDKRCYHVYEYIVSKLEAVYGPIPNDDMQLACPSLRESSARKEQFKARSNKSLQKREYKVRVVKSPSVHQEIDGWSMLLRYFTEFHSSPTPPHGNREDTNVLHVRTPSAVGQYTKRHTSMLVWRWR